MGWFKKALTKVVKSPVGKVMDTVSATFSHPIQTAAAIVSPTKTIKQVTEKHFSQSVAKQTTDTVLATGGYVAALYAGAAVATKGLAASMKVLIPATLKGKVIAGVTAPIALGAVIQSPELLGKAAGAPSELAQFGGDVAKFAADPSADTFKDILEESPVISAVVAGAGIVVAGKAVLPAISGYLTREEMEKQTAALEKSAAAAGGNYIGGGSPILPATSTITTGRKPYKRRAAKKTPSVRQSVVVSIINKPVTAGIRISNKRYIKNELLN